MTPSLTHHSDSDQHQTTSLQCTQAVKRLVCVR